MPFGGNIYQVVLALAIGVVCAFRSDHAHSQAAALGAKASFIIGTAFILFSESRWWPATWSIVSLVSWVFTGWLAAGAAYYLARRLKGLMQKS